MNKKVTWGDLQNAHFKDLKRVYRLNDRQLENAVRNHMDGASAKERRELYETVWSRKKD